MFSQEFSCKYICQRSFWVGVLKEYPSIFLHVDLDANTGKVLKSSLSNWALFGMLPWLSALTLFDLGIFCDGVLLIRVMAQYVSMCFNMFQYVSTWFIYPIYLVLLLSSVMFSHVQSHGLCTALANTAFIYTTWIYYRLVYAVGY